MTDQPARQETSPPDTTNHDWGPATGASARRTLDGSMRSQLPTLSRQLTTEGADRAATLGDDGALLAERPHHRLQPSARRAMPLGAPKHLAHGISVRLERRSTS